MEEWGDGRTSGEAWNGKVSVLRSEARFYGGAGNRAWNGHLVKSSEPSSDEAGASPVCDSQRSHVLCAVCKSLLLPLPIPFPFPTLPPGDAFPPSQCPGEWREPHYPPCPSLHFVSDFHPPCLPAPRSLSRPTLCSIFQFLMFACLSAYMKVVCMYYVSLYVR